MNRSCENQIWVSVFIVVVVVFVVVAFEFIQFSCFEFTQLSCYVEWILEFLKLHTNDNRYDKDDNKHVKLSLQIVDVIVKWVC